MVGASGKSYGFINEDADSERLQLIPPAVHGHGSQVLMQLLHGGRYGRETAFGLEPVAPSAVYSPLNRAVPRAMTEEEIIETIEDFATGAARARELGFDGVELMGSEGYLINQFTAPRTNQREDDWGGDPRGSAPFPVGGRQGGPTGDR